MPSLLEGQLSYLTHYKENIEGEMLIRTRPLCTSLLKFKVYTLLASHCQAYHSPRRYCRHAQGRFNMYHLCSLSVVFFQFTLL